MINNPELINKIIKYINNLTKEQLDKAIEKADKEETEEDND